MSSDIQFGEVEQHGPSPGIRPDEDASFCVTPVGKIDPDDLLIFVDLDVARDMEAHALTNTSVELGGVMLGMQHVDENGRPFVVVSDSLRARHYEATKGSFKFTHDTWSQITAERAEFRPDLEMVGWYHTHPSWSVFLSGMDLFICNNFFNRDLDVALVIDPCQQDRGWFQWTTASGGSSSTKKTRATSGFLLTSNRYRKEELEHFASIYSKEPKMNVDPRYTSGSIGGTVTQPVVNIMENSRRPMMDFALLSMLGLQFLFLTLIAWRMLSPPQVASQDDVADEKIVQVEQYIQQLQSQKVADLETQALKSVLQTLVSSQNGPDNLVENYNQLQQSHVRAVENINGQRALVMQKSNELSQVAAALQEQTKATEAAKKELATAAGIITKFEVTNKELEERLKIADPKNLTEDQLAKLNSDSTYSVPWWMAGIGGLLLTGIGFFGGRFQARDPYAMDDDHEDERDSRESRERNSGSKRLEEDEDILSIKDKKKR